MTDKDDKPQLMRRGGRRISIPSSPISPSLSKRYDRFYRSPDVVNSIDTHAVDPPTDPPPVDTTIPTLIHNVSVIPPNVNGNSNGKLSTVHMAITEEQDKTRQVEQGDYTRLIHTAGRLPESRQSQSFRPPFLADANTKSSPVMGRISEARERNFETSVPAGRNYSTTSLSTERSASDENVTAKVSTAKKSRLNLLNPMSLIGRRRSSQNTKLEEMNVNVSPVPAIPENFDPSIRGNFVHDFSTPRNKKPQFENSPRRETFSSPTSLRRPSDFGTPPTFHGSSPSPALHSPLFREHFQDDDNALQPGQTAYLHNAATSRKLYDTPSPANLPSFAQKLPATIPEPEKASREKKLPPIIIPQPEGPPPPPPKRTPSPRLDLPSTALPKHMTSVSSRFSFQIAGQASSAQEKLLEEKHKEHYPPDAAKVVEDENVIDENYDDYDFDADDDFEERIPGVNIDYDEDDGFYNEDIPTKNVELQSSQQQALAPGESLQAFHFTPTEGTFSPVSPYDTSEPTPRDVDGFAIGIADTKESPLGPTFDHRKPMTDFEPVPQLFLEGLLMSTVGQNQSTLEPAVLPPEIPHQTFDDVDLYFDDGEFDMDQIESDVHFDERLLDDDESGQIRDIPAENAKRYEAALERSAPGDRISAVKAHPNVTGISRDTSSSSNFVDLRFGDSSDFPSSREQEGSHHPAPHTTGLTEGNLAAYHDALVEATNYAAANGKFNRQISFSSDVSDDIEPTGARGSQTNPTTYGSLSQIDANSEDLDDYAFDEDMDDDLMIAEANAEALENDDDGFYGQEFGFFARAHGKENSEYVNGGFFAARGSNGVKRSHSGKANFQEPSLTPITERSEWSTRNSVAGLPGYGGFPLSAQSMPSPGATNFLDSPSFEDDMTLSALIKLRRSAWGGSSTSVNSLGDRSMPASSPLAHVSSYTFPIPDNNYIAKQNQAPSASIMESEEEEDVDFEQLTLTQNTPRKPVPGASLTTPQNQAAHLAVFESPNRARKGHHRRNSSGADSVSYVRDQDGHWVLERRRTGDDGEQEVVEREYLVGARI